MQQSSVKLQLAYWGLRIAAGFRVNPLLRGANVADVLMLETDGYLWC